MTQEVSTHGTYLNHPRRRTHLRPFPLPQGLPSRHQLPSLQLRNRLTFLQIWHPRRRHPKRIKHGIIIHTPRRIPQPPELVVIPSGRTPFPRIRRLARLIAGLFVGVDKLAVFRVRGDVFLFGFFDPDHFGAEFGETGLAGAVQGFGLFYGGQGFS
jgi:hypothetical protein